MKLTIILATTFTLLSVLAGHSTPNTLQDGGGGDPPHWLSLGEPIQVDPVRETKENLTFRSIAGGSTNSRNRVQIPERNIEFEVDYPISWSRGSSLSPDGKTLIVNSGVNYHLYSILDDGEYKKLEANLPTRTYDEGAQGYMREWYWVDNDVLACRAEIVGLTGDDVMEVRNYVFFMKEKTLSLLDFSHMKSIQNADTVIDVVGIGSELKHLKISVGDEISVVKADIKVPMSTKSSENRTKEAHVNSPGEVKQRSSGSNGEPVSSNGSSEFKIGSYYWLALIGLLALVVYLIKKKNG